MMAVQIGIECAFGKERESAEPFVGAELDAGAGLDVPAIAFQVEGGAW